jgi:secreted Zn-dependent insulinase-like peptidase
VADETANADAFLGALDRFARFFAAPLFDPQVRKKKTGNCSFADLK